MSPARRTRGKTRPGRLARLDPWILEHLPGARPLRILDIGIGAEPDTTLELHRAAQARHPDVQTVGTDVDPERVQKLEERATEGVRGVHAGVSFVPAQAPHLIRAANILRQYRLDRVTDALRTWGEWLAPEGRLVEGSTDREGSRGVFRSFRRRDGALQPEALIVCVDLDGRGFAPRALTPYLPRGMGWHGHPGPEVTSLFDTWNAAFLEAQQAGARTTRELFIGSAQGMARRGRVRSEPQSWRQGRLAIPAQDNDQWGLSPSG